MGLVQTKPMPTADVNGTISWQEAVRYVWDPANPELCLLQQFAMDYGRLMGERIDLGELRAWHSERFTDLMFP